MTTFPPFAPAAPERLAAGQETLRPSAQYFQNWAEPQTGMRLLRRAAGSWAPFELNIRAGRLRREDVHFIFASGNRWRPIVDRSLIGLAGGALARQLTTPPIHSRL